MSFTCVIVKFSMSQKQFFEKILLISASLEKGTNLWWVGLLFDPKHELML